jgi:tetrahydromethanopterin S-methyltransferase subunit G
MKKYTVAALFFSCLLFTACNTATPEKYFDIAVLNSNMLNGFASEGQLRQMESPSAKMDEKGQAVASKRLEELNQKIQFVEEEYKKVKDLKETEDAKDILQSSVALYDLVIPVYKTEYTQLATAYDNGVAKEQLQQQAKAINEKYFAQYQSLYNKLIAAGKLYATKHNIKVNWAVD